MAEGHRHHLFHHKKEDETPVEGAVYSETAYGSGPEGAYAEITEVSAYAEPEVDYKKEEKHHKHLEQLGELGAAAAGAYALYEKHEAKKDPGHAHRHKMEEEEAAAARTQLKFWGEFGAAAATNPWASISIKFKWHFERQEA